jgi:hypothetical protein
MAGVIRKRGACGGGLRRHAEWWLLHGSGWLQEGWGRLRCDAVGGGCAVDAVRGDPSNLRLHGVVDA